MKNYLILILIFGSIGIISVAYALDTHIGGVDIQGPLTIDDHMKLASAKAVYWVDHAHSIARTDTTGKLPGNFLNIRGFDGVVIRTGGTGAFGEGNEQVRIANSGVETLKMADGKAVKFVDHGISVSRTNSVGDDTGNFLNLRGWEGIVFRTLGDTDFGSGTQQMKITQFGDLELSGDITSSSGMKIAPNGDLCLGSGCLWDHIKTWKMNF